MISVRPNWKKKNRRKKKHKKKPDVTLKVLLISVFKKQLYSHNVDD